MLSSRHRLFVSVRAAVAVALIAGGVSVAGASSAQAVAPDSPVTLKIVTPTDKGFTVGDPISFTFTATNTTSAAVTFPERAQIKATYEYQYDDPQSKPKWSGACERGGFGDYGDFVVDDYAFVLPPTLAPGAAVTCKLTYPATKFDVDNGGAWTHLYYVADYENSDEWSPGWWWTAVAADATVPMLSVAGSQTEGSILTAKRGYWAIWDTPTAYQWLRDGVAIDGATALTYTMTSDDVGHAITVRSSATSSFDGSGITWTSEARPLILTTGTPAVSGTAKVGHTVTAKPGTWTAGASLAYQWYLSGKAVSGATKPTYDLTGASAGKTVTVKVTGKKIGYTSASATSSGRRIAAGTLTTHKPSISGTAAVGKTLTASPGTWTSTTTFHYQWNASGKAISKATAKTLKLTSGLRGKTITVKVTGSKTGYASAAVTSSSTKAVAK